MHRKCEAGHIRHISHSDTLGQREWAEGSSQEADFRFRLPLFNCKKSIFS